MLKVAQKSDYALLIVVSLAERGDDVPLSLDELARKEAVSQGYLEEVAGLLRAAGIITGRRGAHGGYVLARPASEISLANVLTATEGGAWTTECIGESGAASRTRTSGDRGRNLWRKVQGQVMATLHGMTVADIVAERVTDKV